MKALLKTLIIMPNSELENEDVLYIGNIPTTEDKPHPKCGVTFFYSYKQSVNSIANIMKKYENSEESVHVVNVVVDVEKSKEAPMPLSELPQSTILYLGALKKDLYDTVKKHYEVYARVFGLLSHLKKLGMWDAENDCMKTKGAHDMPLYYPDVVRYLWEQPEFNHLDVIVYNVFVNETVERRATLFRPDKVYYNDLGSIDAELALYPEKIFFFEDDAFVN